MKILVYANAPCVPTGFGVVIREIFTNMVARGRVPIEDLWFYGINYIGDPHDLPFKIYPAQIAASRDPDLYGRQRLCFELLANPHCPYRGFDTLFVLEDHFTVAAPVMIDGKAVPFLAGLIDGLRTQGRAVSVVQYIPVDCETVRPEWVTWMVGRVDAPVAYTRFGRRVLADNLPTMASQIRVIPHGTDPDSYFPIPEGERLKFRREVLNVADDVPLIGLFNRNQPRKDVPRALQVFQRVLKDHPEAMLYCHMNVHDSAGYQLAAVINDLCIPAAKVLFPQGFSEGIGVARGVLNMLYNSVDVCLTTARGEGWGLPVTEAMAAGRVVVAPDHTSLSEILADGRGIIVPTEKYPVVSVSDNNLMRPLSDVEAMAEAIVTLIREPERRQAIGVKCREWAMTHTWKEHVVPMWEEVFSPRRKFALNKEKA